MSAAPSRLSAAERALLEALRGLRFGAVEAVVHDGRVVRIERREKVRIEDDPDLGVPAAELDFEPGARPELRSGPPSQSRGKT